MSVIVDLWDVNGANEDWTRSMFLLGEDAKIYARSRWPRLRSDLDDVSILVEEPESEIFDLGTCDLLPIETCDLMRPCQPMTLVVDMDDIDCGSYSRDVSFVLLLS